MKKIITFRESVTLHLKRGFITILEKYFSKEPIKNINQFEKNKIKNILVIRPHDQLGDFLLSTPVLRALRDFFPQANIELVVKDYFADSVKYNNYIDNIVIVYESLFKWTPGKLFKFVNAVFKKKWDLAIVLNSESHSLTSDLIAHFSKALFVLGSNNKKYPGTTRNFFYNLISDSPKIKKHQTERNLDIVRHLGIDTKNLQETTHVNEAEYIKIKDSYKSIYEDKSKIVIGMHIGANKVENRWPVQNFCELGYLLSETHDLKINIFWGPKESDLKKQFSKRARFQYTAISPANIQNLAIHFKLCDLVICHDTGVMHLCAAVNTPLVAIFGPTDPKYWKPIGEDFIAIRNQDGVTGSVSVKQVKTTVEKLINQVQGSKVQGSGFKGKRKKK